MDQIEKELRILGFLFCITAAKNRGIFLPSLCQSTKNLKSMLGESIWRRRKMKWKHKMNRKNSCILVAADLSQYDIQASLDELEELTKSAGGEVVARLTQKREELSPATCIGEGRLQELKTICETQEAELVIFDHELTAVQLRNLEDRLDRRVIDRTQLILDIFARRAVTSEGKLQVELAQQKYRLPRLLGMGKSLSRLGGGIGTRGPGESKLESDRRHIRRRISSLEQQLKALEKRRNNMAQKRIQNGVLTVAIVGYTNSGKSTLLNQLTGSQVLAKDMLFATLDPTSRGVALPDGRTVLVIDTVGFISRLPHNLVEAFHSTLEVAVYADLVLNVCDASNPTVKEQQEVTVKLLEELGVEQDKILTVFNKIDLVPGCPDLTDHKTVMISAKEKLGFEGLLDKIAALLPATSRRMSLLIPFDQAGLCGKIRQEGKVFSESYKENGILLDALVDQKLWKMALPYAVTTGLRKE